MEEGKSEDGSVGSYNYVVTAHKPSNTTHSVYGRLTGPKDHNLILA